MSRIPSRQQNIQNPNFAKIDKSEWTHPRWCMWGHSVTTTRRDALVACLVIAQPFRSPAMEPMPVEPAAEAALYEACQGRRLGSWTTAERPMVDTLVDELVALRVPWRKEMLRGKWRLAYLQPAPEGAGVDRRIPFPELPWNEQYQIFGRSDVINVRELLGPVLEVRAAGRVAEDDSAAVELPKRFRVGIEQGALCGSITIGRREKANTGRLCSPLSIHGEGTFDAQYVGSRIRISRNMNGGGARTVHVRVTSFGGFAERPPSGSESPSLNIP